MQTLMNRGITGSHAIGDNRAPIDPLTAASRLGAHRRHSRFVSLALARALRGARAVGRPEGRALCRLDYAGARQDRRCPDRDGLASRAARGE